MLYLEVAVEMILYSVMVYIFRRRGKRGDKVSTYTWPILTKMDNFETEKKRKNEINPNPKKATSPEPTSRNDSTSILPVISREDAPSRGDTLLRSYILDHDLDLFVVDDGIDSVPSSGGPSPKVNQKSASSTDPAVESALKDRPSGDLQIASNDVASGSLEDDAWYSHQHIPKLSAHEAGLFNGGQRPQSLTILPKSKKTKYNPHYSSATTSRAASPSPLTHMRTSSPPPITGYRSPEVGMPYPQRVKRSKSDGMDPAALNTDFAKNLLRRKDFF